MTPPHDKSRRGVVSQLGGGVINPLWGEGVQISLLISKIWKIYISEVLTRY